MMNVFMALTLTLSTLVFEEPANCKRIQVCREVCSKTGLCKAFPIGIFKFACHQNSPINHFIEDTDETVVQRRHNRSMGTVTDMKCVLACKSVMEMSDMTSNGNGRTMVHGRINETKDIIDSKVEVDRGGITDSKTLSQPGSSEQNKDMKEQTMGRGGVNASKGISQPGSSEQNKDMMEEKRGRGGVNASKGISQPGSSEQNKDMMEEKRGRGGVNASKGISQPGSSEQNKDMKEQTMGRDRVNASKGISQPGSSEQNKDMKEQTMGRDRVNASKGISQPGSSEQNKDMMEEKRGRGGNKDTSETEPLAGINLQTQNVNGKDTGQSERSASTRPEGYEKLTAGKTTFYVKEYHAKKTWEKALATCRSDGGTLVIIDSSDKQRSLSEHASFKSHWIGLRDIYHNDTYFWVDGSTLSFSKWQKDQPSLTQSDGQDEDCVDLSVHILKGQGWNDQPCTNTYQFFCEI